MQIPTESLISAGRNTAKFVEGRSQKTTAKRRRKIKKIK
jgi:hypothetical protein